MSVIKKLAGQAATYGLSSILGRVINFLLVPFYTDPGLTGIKTDEFGIYTELYAYTAFLNIVYLYGMETAFFRFSTRESEIKGNTYNTAESSLILSSFLFSAFLVLFAGPISGVLGYQEKQSYIIQLSLIMGIDAIVAIPYARLRLENKAAKFAILKLSNIFLNVFFNILFLYFFRQIYLGKMFPEFRGVVQHIYIPGFEVGYIILSNLLANLLQVPLLWSSFRQFKFGIDKALLKEMLIYAYPMVFTGLAGMVNEVLSRIALKGILPVGFYPGKTTLDAIGIFGACYKLSMFMSLAIQAFRYAAEPFFFSQAKDKKAASLFASVMKYFIITCTLIYVAVGCNLPFFGQILRSATYREGLAIVPFLLLANLFMGIYANLSVWYKLTDKTYAGTVLTFMGAGITIVANLVLIPIMGYLGASIATLICYFSMTVLSYAWGQKHFPVPYDIKSAVLYIGISSAMIWFAEEFMDFTGIYRHLAGFGLVLAYVLFVALFEKNKLKKALRAA